MAAAEMPRVGKLYAYSRVFAGPKKWRKPMVLGYVDLPNGVRVFSHLAGEGLAVDQAVELAIGVLGEDDDGEIVSFVFQPKAA